MEGISYTQHLKAKELAKKRQKRFKRQVKVKVARGTWIYVPKEMAKSKKKLRAFLEKRQERMRQKAEQENQRQKGRQQRSKVSYKTYKGQRKAEVRKIMGSNSPEQKKQIKTKT